MYGAYSYLLIITGIIFLADELLHSPQIYWTQAFALLLSVLAPWATNWAFAVGLSPVPHLDLTPVAFVVTGLALAWAVARAGLLDITSMARKAILETMADGVIVHDAQDRIVDLNSTAQQINRRPEVELIGQPVSRRWPELAEVSSDENEMRSELAVVECGGQRYYEKSFSPLHDNLGRRLGQVILLRDITDRKRSELALQKAHDESETRIEERTAELSKTNEILKQELAERERLEKEILQMQRMETIGRLTGGVAHDFNNLLTPIIGYAELGIRGLPTESHLKDDLQEIRKAAHRAADLVRDLASFSRGQVLFSQFTNLNDVVLKSTLWSAD